MRKSLRSYISLLFLQRLLITLFALVTLLSVLDSLANADNLPPGLGLFGQLRYMGLRLPVLFDRALLFSILLSVLLTYVSLSRRNEMVALSASGMSIFGQMKLLMPVVFIAGAVFAVAINYVSPPASRALQTWLGTKALQGDEQTPQKLWLSDENRLVELEEIKGDELFGVTIFNRDNEGFIVSVTTAGRAIAAPGGWRLKDASQRRFDNETSKDDLSFWPSPQTPDSLRDLMLPPRDVGFATLLSLSEMRDSGSRPSSAYILWALNRAFLPVTAVGFLILGTSIMQVYGRRANADLAAAAGVGIGFVYLVIDGILKTLAENGSFNPVLTIVLPNLVLILAGLWLALEREIKR
jgi:lipopolysaccharide export system permease protein